MGIFDKDNVMREMFNFECIFLRILSEDLNIFSDYLENFEVIIWNRVFNFFKY